MGSSLRSRTDQSQSEDAEISKLVTGLSFSHFCVTRKRNFDEMDKITSMVTMIRLQGVRLILRTLCSRLLRFNLEVVYISSFCSVLPRDRRLSPSSFEPVDSLSFLDFRTYPLIILGGLLNNGFLPG